MAGSRAGGVPGSTQVMAAAHRLVRGNTGAIMTYTILGAHYYSYSIYSGHQNPIMIVKAPYEYFVSLSFGRFRVCELSNFGCLTSAFGFQDSGLWFRISRFRVWVRTGFVGSELLRFAG